MSGWDQLDPVKRREKMLDARAAEDDALAAKMAVAFGGGVGADCLDYLRRITKERVLGPDASDAMLRFMEGQRYLVNRIETLVARGNQIARK